MSNKNEIALKKDSFFVSLKKGFSPVKEISHFTVKAELSQILRDASFEANQSMADDPQVLKFQTEALYFELRGKLSTLTIPEIREAFRMGVRNKFTKLEKVGPAIQEVPKPWFGFCPATYNMFLTSFFNLPNRGKDWIEYLNEEDELKISDKPTSYTQEQWIEVCKITFNNYKEREGDVKTLWVNASAASIYDIINSKLGTEYKHPKGIIRSLVTDQEIRKDLASLAQAEYTGFKRDLKKMGYLKDKKEEDEFDKGTGYSNILKKHYLIHFFDSLIEQGKGLEM